MENILMSHESLTRNNYSFPSYLELLVNGIE